MTARQSLGGTWASPNGSRASTRAATRAAITSRTVATLEPAWRFRFRGKGGGFGLLTSTPLVVGGTVYVQDAKSSVFALERSSGRLRWARIYSAPNDGPNGAAVVGGRVVRGDGHHRLRAQPARTGGGSGAAASPTVTSSSSTSRPSSTAAASTSAPSASRPAAVARSTRSTRGTGRVRWKFDTVAKRVAALRSAGGGGAWNPVSVDAAGRVYAGISNPGPWGGTKARPERRRLAGRALYTNSLVVLDGRDRRGSLWYDQVFAARRPRLRLPRDADPRARPAAASVVFGAGKAGRVVAWDRATRRRVWSRAVGTHLNDVGPLPHRPTRVCPGLFGGVLTSDGATRPGRLFVPVVELCMTESASAVGVAPSSGRPRRAEASSWRSSANDGTAAVAARSRLCALRLRDRLAGRRVRADVRRPDPRASRLGRAQLWRDRAPAGINGCPSISGDMLFVPAGAPHRDFRQARAAARRLPRALHRTIRTPWKGRLCPPKTTSSSSAPSRPSRSSSRTSRPSSTARPSRSSSCSPRSRLAGTCSSRTCPARRRRCSPDRSPARSSGAAVGRVQCTPDIQPTDVTGLSVYDQRTREFEFRPGPVFANVLLVDEINRAMPKTQSALLEAMARAPGDRRRRHASAARPVPAARDGEPDRAGGHVPAARRRSSTASRSRSHSAIRRSTRRSRSSAASARSIPSRSFAPSSTLDDVARRWSARSSTSTPTSSCFAGSSSSSPSRAPSRASPWALRFARASRSSGSRAPGRSSTVATT